MVALGRRLDGVVCFWPTVESLSKGVGPVADIARTHPAMEADLGTCFFDAVTMALPPGSQLGHSRMEQTSVLYTRPRRRG